MLKKLIAKVLIVSVFLVFCFFSPHASPVYASTIAFDSAANLFTPGNGSNLSQSFTNTAGNLLIVAFWSGLGSGIPTITTVSYGGNAMTQLYTSTGASQIFQVYYLQSPPTGANTLEIDHTGGGNCYTYSYVASYSGANTSSAIDASGTASTFSAATSLSRSVTTVADNAWGIIVQMSSSNGSTPAAGANTTLRTIATDGYWGGILDTNLAKTPAGSVTLNTTFASDSGWAVAFSIKPTATASVPKRALFIQFE